MPPEKRNAYSRIVIALLAISMFALGVAALVQESIPVTASSLASQLSHASSTQPALIANPTHLSPQTLYRKQFMDLQGNIE